MPDIELYKKSADKYEDLQNRRPDYVAAREVFIDFAFEYLKDKKQLVVADFCCGTGSNSVLISQKLSLKKVALIDINKQFLDIAVKSGIKALEVLPIQSDVLGVDLKSEYDLVISMFAYHHVPDKDKAKYIEIVRNSIKPGGILLLGEIYSPDKQTTLAYYNHLIKSIPENDKTPELEKFLKQTAKSDDFEYKVSQKFAHDQLIAAGFSLLNSQKIWSKYSKFPDDFGTFTEVWEFAGSL